MSAAQSEEQKKLVHDVQRAISTLETLTTASKLPRGSDKLPLGELNICQGLVFTFNTKAGLGLSIEHGHGFLICKLPVTAATQGSSSNWTWSAPLFLTLNAASLGITAGFSHIDSITILDTDAAVQSFCKTVLEINTDLTAAAGSVAGAHLPATAANLSKNDLSAEEFTYSIADGVMIDISLTGMAFTVDSARNKAMYGEFASPAAIINGGVATPVEMYPLYHMIDSAIMKSAEKRSEP